MPVVTPVAQPGSELRSGEPLKASKRETGLKMRLPLRPHGDDVLDRSDVEAQQCVERTDTNGRKTSFRMSGDAGSRSLRAPEREEKLLVDGKPQTRYPP